MKYLALGDSYTIGEGVERSGSYPYLLKQFLEQNNVRVDVEVIAKTGWTAQELFGAYNGLNVKREYDLVSLLIGVNNQYRKHDFNYFAKGFEIMLNESISKSKLGERGVFVLSIPNYGLTPFGLEQRDEITKEIESYNEHIERRCKLYGVHFIDISNVYGQYAHEYLVEDKLHPSDEMYAEWVNSLKGDVLSFLSN